MRQWGPPTAHWYPYWDIVLTQKLKPIGLHPSTYINSSLSLLFSIWESILTHALTIDLPLKCEPLTHQPSFPLCESLLQIQSVRNSKVAQNAAINKFTPTASRPRHSFKRKLNHNSNTNLLGWEAPLGSINSLLIYTEVPIDIHWVTTLTQNQKLKPKGLGPTV